MSVRTVVFSAALLVATPAAAAPITVLYDTLREEKRVNLSLNPTREFRLEGRVHGLGGLDNTFAFTAGSSAVSMAAS